ncbi:MAG: hypothetical protein IPN59_09270 [Holophaga sp.]|nr:hypothetical protein [Holophaga sp.]
MPRLRAPGTADPLNLIKEVLEADMGKALAFGKEQIKALVKLQKDLQAKVGKPKVAVVKAVRNDALYTQVQTAFAEKPEMKKDLVACFGELKETLFRNAILKQGVRLDGRKTDQIRPLNIEIGVLPAAHGSCLFTRSETQALVTTTLRTINNTQIIVGLEEDYRKKIYLH